MPDKFDFEQRLHALASGLPELRDYYAEMQTFTDLTPRESGKFQREIEHTFFELSGETYQSGDLS